MSTPYFPVPRRIEALDHAIGRIEAATGADKMLDALCAEALGYEARKLPRAGWKLRRTPGRGSWESLPAWTSHWGSDRRDLPGAQIVRTQLGQVPLTHPERGSRWTAWDGRSPKAIGSGYTEQLARVCAALKAERAIAYDRLHHGGPDIVRPHDAPNRTPIPGCAFRIGDHVIAANAEPRYATPLQVDGYFVTGDGLLLICRCCDTRVHGYVNRPAGHLVRPEPQAVRAEVAL